MLELAIVDILSNITDIPVRPVFGTEIPCITYSVTPVNGGIVKQDQVELKIIHQDFEEALNIRQKILEKLDMTQEKPNLVSNNIALFSSLAGGGFIFSDGPQAWEVTVYFIMKWRKI